MPAESQTIAEALAETTRVLREHGVPDSSIEARSLVRAVLMISQTELLTGSERPIGSEARTRLGEFVARRTRREPLWYITREVEFYGRAFFVDERVLIPRPETELLVEQALLHTGERRADAHRILDIGTGSGVIAVTMAAELPGARVVATDISQDALDVAGENAVRNGVSGNIEFQLGSLTQALTGKFDVVLCNPPYVLSGFLDGPEVQPELAYEPRTALDGGVTGMDVYGPLLTDLRGVMGDGGAAFIEIDPPVAEHCMKLARSYVPDATVSVLTDLAGLERCMVIELPVG